MKEANVERSLKQLIAEFQPRHILAIGPAVQDLLADYMRDCQDCELQYFESAPALDNLELAHRFDLAVLSHTIEYLTHEQAEQLLARLRDILCQRVIVVVPIGSDWKGTTSHWQADDLLGLGFTQVGEFYVAGKPVHIYAFDMAHYKQTPGWLNDQYWANPEMFGKYWW